MTYILKCAALCATLALIASPANAGVTGEVNGAKIKGEWGGELAVGYTIFEQNGIRITPVVGFFLYEDDNDVNDGCQYKQYGQVISTSSDCEDLLFYGGAEATYSIPGGVTVGAGAMYLDKDVTPYGTVGVAVAPKINVKAKAGKDYVAAGVHFGF